MPVTTLASNNNLFPEKKDLQLYVVRVSTTFVSSCIAWCAKCRLEFQDRNGRHLERCLTELRCWNFGWRFNWRSSAQVDAEQLRAQTSQRETCPQRCCTCWSTLSRMWRALSTDSALRANDLFCVTTSDALDERLSRTCVLPHTYCCSFTSFVSILSLVDTLKGWFVCGVPSSLQAVWVREPGCPCTNMVWK